MPATTPPLRWRRQRETPSLLSLVVLLLLVLTTIPSVSAGTGWRPTSEFGALHLGTETKEGVKVKGYEGEWPLWKGFRESLKSAEVEAHSPQPGPGNGMSGDAVKAPAGTAKTGQVDIKWTCKPQASCSKCPEDVKYQPYCKPYGNRQTLLCTSSPSVASSNPSTSTTTGEGQTTIQAYTSCGKVVQDEARDYLEFVMSTALVAVVAIVVFVRRQKFLFQKQDRLLSFRVSGSRGTTAAAAPRRAKRTLG